uniref:Membrane magnesium transporter n=1 Tax=Steinernema glaseri TaxID=37863 RepID=A0A1I8ABF2_9BILA
MSALISQSTYKFICIASLLSLLHCAYSAAQHRFYLRLIEEPFTRLPVDIVLQTLISLVVLVYSASFVAGEFRPIRGDHLSSKKSWDTVGNCPSFYSFEHRGKTLSPTYGAFAHRLSASDIGYDEAALTEVAQD